VSDEVVWFHGTRRGFTRNGWLFPRAFHGGVGTSAPLQPGRESPADSVGFIYITTDENLAWAYAYEAVGRGKPKVLVVEPQGEIEHDPEHSHDMPAYRCNGMARVVDVFTDAPFTEEESRAGWVVYGK
jgi:hypothetical protein